MTKSNAYKKAEIEFELLEKTNDPDNNYIVLEFKKEILALVDKFGKSGQSGASAPYTSKVICDSLKKLFAHETLSPLTLDDSEFENVDYFPNMTYQNKRNSAVFKDNSTGKSSYLNAIIWKGEEEYDTFTGTVDGIRSSLNIKNVPFEPKTFYIDVCKDCGVYHIKDTTQLDQVRAYYEL